MKLTSIILVLLLSCYANAKTDFTFTGDFQYQSFQQKSKKLYFIEEDDYVDPVWHSKGQAYFLRSFDLENKTRSDHAVMPEVYGSRPPTYAPVIDSQNEYAVVSIATNGSASQGPIEQTRVYSLSQNKLMGENKTDHIFLYGGAAQGNRLVVYGSLTSPRNNTTLATVLSLPDLKSVFEVKGLATYGFNYTNHFLLSHGGRWLTWYRAKSENRQNPDFNICIATIVDSTTGAVVREKTFPEYYDCSDNLPLYIGAETKLFVNSGLIWDLRTDAIASVADQIQNVSAIAETTDPQTFIYTPNILYTSDESFPIFKKNLNEPDLEYRFWSQVNQGSPQLAENRLLFLSRKKAEWIEPAFEKIKLNEINHSNQTTFGEIKYFGDELLALSGIDKAAYRYDLTSKQWTLVSKVPNVTGDRLLGIDRNASGDRYWVAGLYYIGTPVFAFTVYDKDNKPTCFSQYYFPTDSYRPSVFMVNDSNDTALVFNTKAKDQVVRVNRWNCQEKETISFPFDVSKYSVGYKLAPDRFLFVSAGEWSGKNREAAVLNITTRKFETIASGFSAFDFDPKTLSFAYGNVIRNTLFEVIDLKQNKKTSLTSLLTLEKFSNNLSLKFVDKGQIAVNSDGTTLLFDWRQSKLANRIHTRTPDAFFPMSPNEIGFIENFNGNFLVRKY